MPSVEPASLPGFATANRRLIEERFLNRCQPLFGTALAKLVAAAVPLALRLDLLLQGLPLAPLSEIVENTILAHRLTPQKGSSTLPAAMVNTGGPRLRLLARVWQGQALSSEDLAALEPPQREELIRYLLLTQGAASWLRQMFQSDEALFQAFLNTPETATVVQHMLLDCLHQDPDLTGLASRLLPEILAQQQGFALLNGQADLLGCLEILLRCGGWDRKTIKPLLAWTRRHERPESGFPYLQAFYQPQQGIAPEVLEDAAVRDSLLECLIAHHNYNSQELVNMGFAEEEVNRFAARANQSWWTRLKRVFRS